MYAALRKLMLSSIAAALLLGGCVPRGDFPVTPVSGKVTCDGTPVPYVMVFFEPVVRGEQALVGKQGIGIADEEGQFVISTYGDQDGAVIGKHRVRVGPPRADDHPDFRCSCDTNSERDVMEVEVTRSRENTFEVVLPKRTPRSSMSPDEVEAREDALEAARMKKSLLGGARY